MEAYMNKNKLEEFYLWFNNYTKSFSSEDQVINTNIRFKIEHTGRVVDKIVEIAKSIKLSEKDMLIAETVGLFHDIGRFEQFSKYKTFKDRLTVDHAELGLEILNRYNILDSLEEEEKYIIMNAIRYHNKYEIPKEETERCILFSKLIRDADKIDILDSIVAYYEEPEKYKDHAFEDYPESKEYEPSIIALLMQGKNISYNLVKTTTDIKLIRLSWIYDIYFNHSINIYKNNGYIERIFRVLPDTEEIRQLNVYMNKYIDSI
jgi:putative nucleotidyltransferase with HDIG domain